MHPVHPAQLYSLANALVLFAILQAVLRRRRYQGQVIGYFILLYGSTRFLLEFLRSDSPIEFNGLTMPQNFCIALFVFGMVLLLVRRRRSVKTGIPIPSPPGDRE